MGSTKVAKSVYGRASMAGKRALCLGGAKNHLFVVPDADVNVTAENVVASFTGCAGQRCMAASVLLAVGDVDHILKAVRDRAAKMVAGKDMGPVTTQAARDRITGYIDAAEKQGAKIMLDGRKASADAGGYWVGPTIIDGCTADMPAAREEIFGPVLSVVRVPTLEKAFEIENANPYGNASSVYTTSGDIARRVMGRVEAGMCGVNIGVPVPREPFGFGGWNDSCFGAGQHHRLGRLPLLDASAQDHQQVGAAAGSELDELRGGGRETLPRLEHRDLVRSSRLTTNPTNCADKL